MKRFPALAEKIIAILPDKDDAGQRYAEAVKVGAESKSGGHPPAGESSEDEPVLAHAALHTILANLLPIDWAKYERRTGKDGDKVNPPSERDYILRTIERILLTAKMQNVPFCKRVTRSENRNNNDEQIFIFSETYYKPLDVSDIQTALIEFGIACGIPHDTAVYQFFVERMYRQFLIGVGRQQHNVKVPQETYINLRNGTLFSSERKRN